MIASLSDIKQELWLRMRNSGDLTIKDKGINKPLKDLTDSELINLFNKLNNPKSYDIIIEDFWI